MSFLFIRKKNNNRRDFDDETTRTYNIHTENRVQDDRAYGGKYAFLEDNSLYRILRFMTDPG